ncbi:hypothetical protein [Cohaesibacter gelatinilyticus]|uniref:DNA primase/helicase n=1 Tax=Cohaesibacter gelatinilyticus TaxID=372072 RepID=A0A285PHN9_9HYPH|nr:hypothetical protein [Cohaesibacter gelatinilyticus]SNZ20938.1 hypothetical protein SAMN06265368_4052 [Cohaesibacter gelatinilyticus]
MSAGAERIKDLVQPAIDRVTNVAGRRQAAIPDPKPGGYRNDVPPGDWEPDELGLPPDCPVEPLGMDGDIIYMIDAMGQLAAVTPSSFGRGYIQRLFANRINYAYWAWPQKTLKSNEIKNWNGELIKETFYTAAANKGLWNAVDKVRGLGAWKGEDGKLILHCGDCLWMNGERHETGEVGEFFYPRRPPIGKPWHEEITLENNPAIDLFRSLKTWNWQRPDVDPFLFLGWLGAAMIGGALVWRPSVFLVGDMAVGKSTLHGLMAEILGSTLVKSADASAAGIYSRVGSGSLPVAIDELEATADNRKVSAVVDLARLAASGAAKLRGAQDHSSAEFNARSCFLFSAINPPPMTPADKSRMAFLSIGKLDFNKAKAPPPLPPHAGAKILRRLADQWARFDETWDAYSQVLKQGGHAGRGQDTFGTLLACAHLMLGDDGLEDLGYRSDDLSGWSELLAAANLSEKETSSENWRDCLEHLLTSRVNTWRNGKQHSIGAVLEAYRDSNNTFMSLSETREMLAQVDLGFLPKEKRKKTDQYGQPYLDPNSEYLAIPNKGPALNELFEGERWAKEVWVDALRQGPSEVINFSKEVNKMKIGGISRRCTLVNLTAFDQLSEEG